MLEGLNDRQREAVLHTGSPVMVLAGAGSGKTRTLTTKIARLLKEGYAPHEIMAVTFTNKAAREMRERVETLVGQDARRMLVSTFHSACVRFLREQAHHIGLDPNFTIYDDSDQKKVIEQAMEELLVNDSRITANACSAFISHVKNQLLDPETTAADHYRNPRLADVFHKYQVTLAGRGALDFDDLLLRVVMFLSLKPDLLQHYRDRYHYLLVDEFQDTNPVQYRLVQLLMGGREGLFIVGDDDQSIYSWRGANPEHMFCFDQDFPGAHIIRLEQNYRSTPQILDAANAVIARNTQRRGKTLWTQRPPGAPVRLTVYADDRQEAQGLARQVQSLVDDGHSLENMAVLYRTNSMSRVLEEALRRAGISHRIVGGVGFYQRREIKDLMAYLRLLLNPMDFGAFERIANAPRRGIGETGLQKIRALSVQTSTSPLHFGEEHLKALGPTGKKLAPFTKTMQEITGLVEELTLPELIETLLDLTGYEAMWQQERSEEADQRLDNLGEFKRMVREQLEEEPDLTLKTLLDGLSLYSDLDQQDDGQKLTLMTLHAAKGLEFNVVFMPGLEEGLMPHSRSLDRESALEEERRLMYVGMTRARKELHLSYAQTRYVYNSHRASTMSRFLREIPDALLSVQDAAPPPQQRGGYDSPWGGQRRSRWHFGEEEVTPSSSRTSPGGPRVVKSVRGGAPAPPPPPPRGQRLGVNTGDRVLHPVLGAGTVLNVMDDRIQIDFDDGKDRWLAWEYAQLSRA